MKFAPLSKSLADAVSKTPLIIGIGPSAWPRIIPSFYFPKYKIISLTDCQDNNFISDFGVEVFSIKKENPYFEISPESPGKIVNNQVSLNYLKSQKAPFAFLVYKSSLSLEALCEEKGWKFIGNKVSLAEYFENKKVFKEILREIGVETIPGENIPIEDLTAEKFIYYQKKLGQKRLVLQLAEVTYGGGSGTLFLDDSRDLTQFEKRVREIREFLEGKKKKIKTVNIAPYINGVSSSIVCCATGHGVFTGPIQTQIIDIKEVGTEIEGRSGNFAGHDWSFRHYPEDSQNQAQKICEKFGEYLYKKGYKGIFGIDLIVEESGKVWPVECNPRYTDAFPVVSMLQMEKGLVPFDVFHCLEHLGIDYDIDFQKMNTDYKQVYDGSQILIHSLVDQPSVIRGSLKAGVYKVAEDRLEYVRPAFLFSDIISEDEFLFTERVPNKAGRVSYPKGRIFRIVKRGGMLQSPNTLKKDVSTAISFIYKELRLLPADSGLVENKGLKSLFAFKAIEAKKNSEIQDTDIVNILNRTQSGFWRPLRIAWRKAITSAPVLGQIHSKRTKKHIISDLKKISELRIEIKILDEIDENLFENWLKVYKKIIGAKEKGHLVIDKSWLAKKKEKNKKVGAVLAFKGNEVIGGDLFFEIAERLSVGYGVAEKTEGLSGGLTLLLDYKFMEYAQKNGYKEISFGQDTNLYGYDLSSGLVSYKAKLGFTPVPANKTYWVSTYFLNLEKFDDPIMFFSGNLGNMELNIIVKRAVDFNPEIYLPLGVKKYNIFTSDTLVKEAKEILFK